MNTNTPRRTIGLLIICTGKYDIFLQRLLDSIDANFFVDDDIVIHLFWDKPKYKLELPARFSVVCIPTKHTPFPGPTIYRYKYFTQAAARLIGSHLFYLDVDMLMVDMVDREILPTGETDGGLVATGHPGFWVSGGAWCDNMASTAYTEEHFRTRYYAGGFQGGERSAYLKACAEMAENIETDEKNGLQAEWHDEQHWNRYLCRRHPHTLSPEYCMVQNEEIKVKYGLVGLTPRIYALDKNHEELRKF